ncbi:MAG TPA: lysophospholipid acyltransferase family protein [Pseudolysinimonas sp.]|nr:lysophospholipid acyltransferase family protein [Pseudolysinimonas sp.]
MPEKTPRNRFTSRSQAAARFVAQRGILKGVVWGMMRVTVIDKQKLKGVKRPFVAVANHSSHLDAPLIMGALPRPLARYLAAGAAGDYFFDVWWRRGLTALFFNAFPVDRSGSNPRNINAKMLLQHDVPVLVFPEGTRSKDGRLGHFKPGGAALATATGVPVIPIAIIGAHEAHPRGSKWPKAGLPVAVVFGAPMRAAEKENPTEFMARVRAVIADLLEQHSARILGTKPLGNDSEKEAS